MGTGLIDRLKVTDFQSIESADIELGKFTVIVGPSNSGKSALLRALKAVVRNVNTPSAVRAGKGAFTSTVVFDGSAVAIERGKSQSTYKVILPDGTEDVFTKSGRAVPEEIQGLLRLPDPEGPDLTFSSQIDPPFLLAETGTVAAKMLGDLTNVSRLHAAAKEANRRRLEASKLADLRKKDAVAIVTRLKNEYGDIKEHAATVKQARADFDAVKAQVSEAEKIDGILEALDLIDSSEKQLQAALDAMPEPADIEAEAQRAGALMGERAVLMDIIERLAVIASSEDNLVSGISAMDVEIAGLEEAHHDALVDLGQCPTCGQVVK